MGYQTRISTKGQIVLPKELRDRLHWEPGVAIEVVEHPGGLTLRAVNGATGESVDDVLARIKARNTYRGPRVSDEEMDEAVRAEAVRRYERSR